MAVAAGLEHVPITAVYIGAALLSIVVGGAMLWLVRSSKPVACLPEPPRRRRRSGSVGLRHRSRPLPRPDFESTEPRAELPGRGADRGYSFVSMSHHTAREGAACDGVNVGEIGAGRPARGRAVMWEFLERLESLRERPIELDEILD
jgi:hypothetical protein